MTDDLYDEAAAVHELLDAPAPTKTARGFDPACAHLLTLGYANLFEPQSAAPGAEDTFRCKGCGATVARASRSRSAAPCRARRRSP